MKMKRRFWFPLCLSGACLLGALALGSCRPLFQRELAGPVLALEGRAQGTRDGKSVGLTTGSWVHPGEKIATTAEARLDLLLVPGVLVALAGDTEIEIERLRLARDGNETINPMTFSRHWARPQSPPSAEILPACQSIAIIGRWSDFRPLMNP